MIFFGIVMVMGIIITMATIAVTMVMTIENSQKMANSITIVPNTAIYRRQELHKSEPFFV